MFSKNSSEMTKSSFHDNNRFAELNNPMGMPESKVQVSNTPTRRQPRFSEPAMFDSPYQPIQDTKASFIPYVKKEPQPPKEEQQEVHFYKKQINTPEQPK